MGIICDDLCLLAEKACPSLRGEPHKALGFNCFLIQLEYPQINFAVRQKQPDQAVQYTLGAKSSLRIKTKMKPTIALISHSKQTVIHQTPVSVAGTLSSNNALSVIIR